MISSVTNEVHAVVSVLNDPGSGRMPSRRKSDISSLSESFKMSKKDRISISDQAKLRDGAQDQLDRPDDKQSIDYGKELKKHKSSADMTDASQKSPDTELSLEKESNTSGSSESIEHRENGAHELSDPTELTLEEKAKLRELKRIDQEIRIHEHLHAAVGGSYARGGPTFQMVLGPDGQQYAVGGHVDIDVSEAATPEETIRKAQIIKAAATAPASPSSADLAIASQAMQMETVARARIMRKMAHQSKNGVGAADNKPINEQTMSDKLVSLIMAIPPLKLEEALKSMRKDSSRHDLFY